MDGWQVVVGDTLAQAERGYIRGGADGVSVGVITHANRALVGAALASSVIAVACTANAAAPTSGLATPVPPAAVSTVPPPKPLVAADPNAAGGPRISVGNFNFTPADITVARGTTVTWTNHDDVQHTVTASDSSFGSSAIETEGSFSFAFAEPGSFSYFCAIHPFMTGRVTVQ
jgi:plastocyanin